MKNRFKDIQESVSKLLTELNPLDFGQPEESVDQSGFILQFDKDGNAIRMVSRGGARDRIPIPTQPDATDANTSTFGFVAPAGTGLSDKPGDSISVTTSSGGKDQSDYESPPEEKTPKKPIVGLAGRVGLVGRQAAADEKSSKYWHKGGDDSRSGSSPSSGSIATVGSSFYDSGKIEQPKAHKFMKASFDPTQGGKNYIQENNNRKMEIKESVSRMFVISENDGKTREQRQSERMRHNIEMERGREEMRQLRQQRKDREKEKNDERTMERYGGENEQSEIDRLTKAGVEQEKIDALPAGGLERAKALQRLAIANSYASAAKTTANFHNLPLGRAAANEILRQQGKDPLPDTATGEDVKGIFIQSRAQAKADKAAYTASQRPKTPAEQAAWLADYKEGERQHRLAKIREFDPQSANALERAHRADQRGKSAEQQWGNISAELDRSMDDIEDQRTQRKIDRFKSNMQLDRETQAAMDAESVKAADEASAASEARINAYTAKGPSRWLETQKRPQIKVGEVAPNVNLPNTPGIELEDPNSWWNASKVNRQTQAGNGINMPKGVGGSSELEPGEGPATTRVGQANNLIQSSVQQITRDAGRKNRGLFG